LKISASINNKKQGFVNKTDESCFSVMGSCLLLYVNLHKN
jgi:hypothetical protein